ncbi:MAG: hypothetical protein KGJ02_02510, partial [Verrucomicrobiota bacterium]|nr:hypothetical protein [Verrucomicrobiota bacterium]
CRGMADSACTTGDTHQSGTERIGGINGMNTSKEEADHMAAYLKCLAEGHEVEWVFNCSFGPIIDIAEIFCANYLGHSSAMSKELVERWTAFHEANKDNPKAKYLHFCHSQGAIHTRNALKDLPEEIRQRIIVVAIAPAAIVPTELCYKSFNYASKNDPVPLGEAFFWGETAPTKGMDLYQQLVRLDPHPEASTFDHEFESPTFRGLLKERIEEYLTHHGEYD